MIVGGDGFWPRSRSAPGSHRFHFGGRLRRGEWQVALTLDDGRTLSLTAGQHIEEAEEWCSTATKIGRCRSGSRSPRRYYDRAISAEEDAAAREHQAQKAWFNRGHWAVMLKLTDGRVFRAEPKFIPSLHDGSPQQLAVAAMEVVPPGLG